jgi:hypothetical protein
MRNSQEVSTCSDLKNKQRHEKVRSKYIDRCE